MENTKLLRTKFQSGDKVKHAMGNATFVRYWSVKCAEIIYDDETGKTLVHKNSIQKV